MDTDATRLNTEIERLQTAVAAVRARRGEGEEQEAAARLLDSVGEDLLAGLSELPGKLSIPEAERGRLLFEGTLMRLRDAVDLAQDTETPPWGAACALQDAAEDLGPRLSERGLLG